MFGTKQSAVDFDPRQFIYTPSYFSISGTSARNSADLTADDYYLYPTVDCFALQGNSSVTAANNTTSPDMPLSGGEWTGPWRVTGSANARIAAITDGASGKLFIKRKEKI